MKKPIIDIIIPAYNEEKSIAHVIHDIPRDWVRDIIVCNNASTDRTAVVAAEAGATVVHQPLKGYGNACLKGMEYVATKAEKPDIIVFLDGDYSDHPEELFKLVAPILGKNNDFINQKTHNSQLTTQYVLVHLMEENAKVDMVIGSRALGKSERGAMTPQQIFGNWLATRLIRLFFGYRFSDLGPFRAIRYPALLDINMVDRNYGWTVEMQVKAAKLKLVCVEIPVTYRQRIGVSKVSGTVKGTIMAGYKILWTIFKYL